jgi:alkanesulfonate monooxygenase SsuD/methylene tetrahydromethanopterin reductase-like flavin-dependent oxidoreductase (luciferase family)
MTVKVSAFELMPYRDLPADFTERYESAWVTVPWKGLADPELVGKYYNWTLDELLYAAEVGFDGICTNEHHQNAYGFMANPNIMGGILARATNGSDKAIIQMGATLPAVTPAVRIAEEYAMLDAISGGRLVAGIPQGTAMDMNFSYGIPPIEQRERGNEAMNLMMRAWTEDEPFAFNGKYTRLGAVNPWPRPIQQPHPPIWIPTATGSRSTVNTALDRDFCFCFLGHAGPGSAEFVIKNYWEEVAARDIDPNPFRLAYLQFVVVADTDAEAERLYRDHIEYFFHKSWHVPHAWTTPPGNMDFSSVRPYLSRPTRVDYKDLSHADFIRDQFVICGGPESVRQQLTDICTRFRAGNLMLIVHIGSMPHELTMYNIKMLGEHVLPHLQPMWENQGWSNDWWPEKLRNTSEAVAAAAVPIVV